MYVSESTHLSDVTTHWHSVGNNVEPKESRMGDRVTVWCSHHRGPENNPSTECIRLVPHLYKIHVKARQYGDSSNPWQVPHLPRSHLVGE
jgi:hypothetical protein